MQLLLSGLFVLTAFFAQAQTQNSLLWEISGSGLEKPSYLFGTIHIKCPETLKLSAGAKEALEATDCLVLELDMDDPNFAAQMQQYSVNEGLKNLSSELAEEDLAVLNAYFKKHYGADMSQLGIMRPFALLSMMFVKALDCPQPSSYEAVLMQEAMQSEEEVLGLETIADQIAVFEGVSTEEQLGWLVEYAKDEEALREGIEKMMAAYDKQDMEELIRISNEFPEYEDLMEALLYQRNENWIAPITEYVKEQPTFIAVGAAHLGSDRGVVALLREAGFTLKPVDNTVE